MKRDEKKQLLAVTSAELKAKLKELATELVKSRQERFVQDKTQVNTKRSFMIRETIKMVKSELRRREIMGEEK